MDSNYGDPFQGTWTLRCIANDRDPTTPFEQLKTRVGVLRVYNDGPTSQFFGLLNWQDNQTQSIRLMGAKSYGDPMQARFGGKAIVGGQEWLFRFTGYLTPHWPIPENEFPQAHAMVGTMARIVAGSAPASGEEATGNSGQIGHGAVFTSYATTFYAVRTDLEPTT